MQSCTGRHRGPARGPDPGPGRRLGVSTRPNPVSFWSTLIFNASGVKGVLDVGLLSAIAPLVGILAMLVVGWDSDRTLARRCHAACVEFVAVRPPWRCPYTIGQPLPGGGADLRDDRSALLQADAVLVGAVRLPVRSGEGRGDRGRDGDGSMAAALTPALPGWIRVETGSLTLGCKSPRGSSPWPASDCWWAFWPGRCGNRRCPDQPRRRDGTHRTALVARWSRTGAGRAAHGGRGA